jgi:hypothetical protein
LVSFPNETWPAPVSYPVRLMLLDGTHGSKAYLVKIG